jgi:hypothetical protein
LAEKNPLSWVCFSGAIHDRQKFKKSQENLFLEKLKACLDEWRFIQTGLSLYGGKALVRLDNNPPLL